MIWIAILLLCAAAASAQPNAPVTYETAPQAASEQAAPTRSARRGSVRRWRKPQRQQRTRLRVWRSVITQGKPDPEIRAMMFSSAVPAELGFPALTSEIVLAEPDPGTETPPAPEPEVLPTKSVRTTRHLPPVETRRSRDADTAHVIIFGGVLLLALIAVLAVINSDGSNRDTRRRAMQND